jgi:hypothetical protein
MATRKSKAVRKRSAGPPPVLAGGRVLMHAVTGLPAKYSGHSNLFVGGKEVGPVPHLVIAESLYEPGIVLLHCSTAWRVLGIMSFPGIEEATKRAERIYPGVSSAWIKAHVSKAQAVKYEKEVWQGMECSFCGRLPPQFQRLISGENANICDLCVRQSTAIIQGDDGEEPRPN